MASIMILNPNASRAALANFLKLTGRVAEVHLTDETTNWQALVVAIGEELRRHGSLTEFVGDSYDQGQQLARELEHLGLSLVVEEAERLVPDLDRFFEGLSSFFGTEVFVFFVGRLLEQETWTPEIENRYVAVVDAELRPLNWQTDDFTLEARLLGGDQVLANGRPIDSWEGALNAHLFYYLLDSVASGSRMVTRDQIFGIFWPGQPVKEATNVYHVTKRNLSEMLGYELTNYRGGFYLSAAKLAISYDVSEFEALLESARRSADPLEVSQYRQDALRLYRAEFLMGHEPYDEKKWQLPYWMWVASRRQELRLAAANAAAFECRAQIEFAFPSSPAFKTTFADYRKLTEQRLIKDWQLEHLRLAIKYSLMAQRVSGEWWADVQHNLLLAYSLLGETQAAREQFATFESVVGKKNVRPETQAIMAALD